jgi:hypothetical protein
MKTPIPRHSSISGSVLLTTLLITGIIGFSVAGYMTLVSGQYRSNLRSQVWNETIPIAEAGVEEALAHLNKNGTNAIAADGWVLVNNAYMKTNTLGASYYIVAISNALSGSTPPTVYTMGYAKDPRGSNEYLKRKVRCVVTNDPLFTKSLVAKGTINLNGQNVESDSFNSQNNTMSTNGKYDRAKRRDHGDIATNSGLIDGLNTGNAKILGMASTGPGGSVAIGPGGSIGDAAWVTNGTTGIQTGHTNDDMNVYFNDVTLPTDTITPLALAKVNGGVNGNGGLYSGYDYAFDLPGTYEFSSTEPFTGRILIKANVKIIVKSSISMNGANDGIFMTNNGSLNLYADCASTQIGGNGVQNPGIATNFYYWGTAKNTSLQYGGNAAFTGVFYAPYADLDLKGGGTSSTTDFSGSAIVKTAKLTGNFNFHYDEALASIGKSRGYVVTKWDEVSWNEL